MRKILWAGLIAATCINPAQALTINVTQVGNDYLIWLQGKFEHGDDERFFAATRSIKSAAVILESEGGYIAPAMTIGRAIRARGYDTVVRDGALCASACALVWFAGIHRILMPKARLGVHSSGLMQANGVTKRSREGNASIRRYFEELRLGYGVDGVLRIFFEVTHADPNQMAWITASDLTRLGLFRHFPAWATSGPAAAARNATSPKAQE